MESHQERATAAGPWPIGRALTVAGVGAVVALAVVTVVALAFLGFPGLARHAALSVSDLLDVLKLVLGTVAGAGALAALVMNYRKQRVAEAAETRERQRMLHEQQRADDDRVRVLNERFAVAAGQLGADEPAVRMAGVYAMAGLADDWLEGRQTCIDVLCAYVRMPYGPVPGPDVPVAQRLVYGRNEEVRRAIIKLISTHLRADARVSWQGHDFDFTGAHFDGGDFSRVVFSGGRISFNFTAFNGGQVLFNGAQFSGSRVSFDAATFSGGQVLFKSAQFTGAHVSFDVASFSGGRIDLSGVSSWKAPASFDGMDLAIPPEGLLLPPAGAAPRG